MTETSESTNVRFDAKTASAILKAQREMLKTNLDALSTTEAQLTNIREQVGQSRTITIIYSLFFVGVLLIVTSGFNAGSLGEGIGIELIGAGATFFLIERALRRESTITEQLQKLAWERHFAGTKTFPFVLEAMLNQTMQLQESVDKLQKDIAEIKSLVRQDE